MRRPNSCPSLNRRRAGKTLVMFALLLPVLLGMVGLVIDGGVLMASHRQTQNAADSAALAAAMDKLKGRSNSVATTTATTYVTGTDYNNLVGATVVINIPPTSGSHAADSNHVEAIVTYPVKTSFIQALGVAQNQQVVGRAVAGLEAVSAGEGAMVLDPNAIPGLSVSGGGTLKVNGRVVVNSQGGGKDENGGTVNLGFKNYAATTGNNSTVKATDIEVVGGVDTPSNFQPYNTGDPSPLHAGALPEPDPLKNLPTPIAGMADVNTTLRGAYSNNNKTETINPGIYDSIKINNNANVTFSPVIYTLRGQ